MGRLYAVMYVLPNRLLASGRDLSDPLIVALIYYSMLYVILISDKNSVTSLRYSGFWNCLFSPNTRVVTWSKDWVFLRRPIAL